MRSRRMTGCGVVCARIGVASILESEGSAASGRTVRGPFTP
jgi:hypothetical protein